MQARTTVMFNNKGVTLIELMVSLVILLIVSLALMQTSLLGISTNMKNQIRDEAVNVAEMSMIRLRSLPFTAALVHADLTATAGVMETPVERKFRGFSIDYRPRRTIVDINTETKQITMAVTWDYRGKTYTHGITSIMRRQ